ncbi:hypothetical protein FHX74_001166 [Friedmanniella endophytica]|uniref:Tat pathway signal sequence domain protein n=1 Tax=Microlunatus kandeliicorticis TaxID=1759536 RepID=A0A7W3P539_9ACTN|nr:hypothetical protein [Microlunatus kandeliicorticis]MBA8793561.1 hypothetical protein [Microlunatus kandeliicorticis]
MPRDRQTEQSFDGTGTSPVPAPSHPAGAFGRRVALGSGAAAVGLGLAGLGTGTASATPTGSAGFDLGSAPARRDDGLPTVDARRAVRFLQGVTDAYRVSGPRLAQSYQDASGLNDIAFVYDNALTIIALLVGGDRTRAAAIGDALIYAQDHDSQFSDGRLRQAYHADTFVNADGTAHVGYEFGLVGTAVGDMAWSGIALAQLARATGQRRFRDAAVRIGTWIQTNANSTTGLGGYTFGATAGLETHKSTEHNIDVYAFFTLLARLTKSSVWTTRAAHAWAFVEQLWNADGGFFWTGSDDGTAINKNPLQLPEDVQSWSWLAARDRDRDAALDWAWGNLASTDTPLRQNSALTGNQRVTGAVFASGSLLTDPTQKIGGQVYNPLPDPAAVWFEGTGQLACALVDHDRRDPRYAPLLWSLGWAQRNLAVGQTYGGRKVTGGLPAASSNLDSGFGFGYYQNLHTAATSWAVFARTATNPYRFPR